MAYSHRPTWSAARGQGGVFDLKNYVTGGVASRQIQEQDLPNHTKLKERQITQGSKEALQTRDLVKELEDKELVHFEEVDKIPENYGIIKSAESLKILEEARDEEVSSAESGSDEESDSDDEEELMLELEKLKREKEAQKRREEEQVKYIEILRGKVQSAGQVKRRWDEDVVFRNQAVNEPKPQKRFINDTTRNDYHKKFLNRFIQ